MAKRVKPPAGTKVGMGYPLYEVEKGGKKVEPEKVKQRKMLHVVAVRRAK